MDANHSGGWTQIFGGKAEVGKQFLPAAFDVPVGSDPMKISLRVPELSYGVVSEILS